MDLDHDDTAASLKQVHPETRKKKAQETLKRVMQKHNHQREKRDFNPAVHQKQSQRTLLSKRDREDETETRDTLSLLEAEDEEDIESRSSRRRGWRRRRRRLFKAVANVASSAGNAVSDAGNAVANTAVDAAAAANDGTGLVGDALGDAYNAHWLRSSLCVVVGAVVARNVPARVRL